jgi:CRISPR-associated endonuclease Cas1
LAASHTLPQSPLMRQLPKHGVLVLYGFGIRIRVYNSHLEIEDGVGLVRRKFLLPRVGHGLKRVIVIGSDGYCTFDAMCWLADICAALIFLDRRGKLLFASSPIAPSDSRLRRAQSTALGNGTALRISREIITQKLDGQAALVRDILHNVVSSDAIARFRAELPSAQSIEAVRIIEAQGAKAYWSAWADVAIRWPRKDERRIPEHWKQFGSRISPLTHSPRLAANPPNAILNLLYALLESESRIAAVAMGLDPGIGLLHVDAPSRDSLACDLMEVCRPKVDAFVLNWIQSEPLRRSDFWEDRNGNCRLVLALAIRLSETADTWRKLVAPVAEYVAQELWSSISKPASRLARQLLATRLTQHNKREVKGSGVPAANQPRLEHVCSDCGVKIRIEKKFCSECAKAATRVNFRAGRKSAQQPESLAKRSATQRHHKQAIHNWKPSDLPDWLSRDVYVKQVQPGLASVPKSRIRSALGVSEPYSSHIRAGKRIPHPRHWQALAELVGVSAERHTHL